MSQRQDTCPGKKCPFWKRYDKYCPFYVTGDWVTVEGHKYSTHDCAPKRTMILTQQIYDQQVCTRKDFNDQRNTNFAALKVLMEQAASPAIEVISSDVEDAKLIEEKEIGKDTD